jgi:hypothetical protein
LFEVFENEYRDACFVLVGWPMKMVSPSDSSFTFGFVGIFFFFWEQSDLLEDSSSLKFFNVESD